MTLQEIYNRALFGIRRQGYQQSLIDGAGHCKYRGDDGLKCGVGHCIDDDSLARAMDAHSRTNILYLLKAPEFAPFLNNIFGEIDAEKEQFLADVQWVHDTGLKQSPENFEYEMKYLAERYSLQYTKGE